MAREKRVSAARGTRMPSGTPLPARAPRDHISAMQISFALFADAANLSQEVKKFRDYLALLQVDVRLQGKLDLSGAGAVARPHG